MITKLGTWRLAACAVATLLLGAAAFADSPPKRKVIIDQDAFRGPNIDPMIMVIQDPDIEVVGITVESGDGWQKESVAQTLRMLELIGRTDIPVVPGATYPLIDSEEETRRWEKLYGKLAYKGAWMDSWPSYNTMNRPHYHAADVVPPLPEGEPTTKPLAEMAASFLARKTREAPGEITILALGPFTNIALAAKLDEGFAANSKELVIMGGSFNPDTSTVDEFSLQFINNPRVEFNSRSMPRSEPPFRRPRSARREAPTRRRRGIFHITARPAFPSGMRPRRPSGWTRASSSAATNSPWTSSSTTVQTTAPP